MFDDGRDMFEVARHFSHFFADESCGFCTPCRVGTSLLARLMDKISDGRGSEHDLQTIEQLVILGPQLLELLSPGIELAGFYVVRDLATVFDAFHARGPRRTSARMLCMRSSTAACAAASSVDAAGSRPFKSFSAGTS